MKQSYVLCCDNCGAKADGAGGADTDDERWGARSAALAMIICAERVLLQRMAWPIQPQPSITSLRQVSLRVSVR